VVFAGRVGHIPNVRDRSGFGFGFIFTVIFTLDGRDGAEKLIRDVGEDGGAARGNPVVRESDEQAGEEIVDGLGGFELGEIGGKGDGQIRFGAMQFGMIHAEAGTRARNNQATAAVGEAMVTTYAVSSVLGRFRAVSSVLGGLLWLGSWFLL
jgi:hypothetical protein